MTFVDRVKKDFPEMVEALERPELPLELWTTWARRDDWHERFVGSDIRQMLGEIKRLRELFDAVPQAAANPLRFDDRDKYIDELEAQIERLTVTPQMYDIFCKLLRTAQLLQQNSEGCAVSHHGLDFEQHGLPGWLADTQKAIDEADGALSLTRPSPHEPRKP